MQIQTSSVAMPILVTDDNGNIYVLPMSEINNLQEVSRNEENSEDVNR